jgi:hypothetical protein
MSIFDDDNEEKRPEEVEQLLSENARDVTVPWSRLDNGPNSDAKVTETTLDGQEPDSVRERLLSETAGVISAEEALGALDDQRVKNTAKRELKHLYGDDFDLSNAPESIDRYEQTLALARLERAAVNMGARPSERREVESDEPRVEQAVLVIEQMKTYGELSEPYLANIARGNVQVMAVREAAVEALSEIREEKKPSHNSLREALAAWLRPGGGD